METSETTTLLLEKIAEDVRELRELVIPMLTSAQRISTIENDIKMVRAGEGECRANVQERLARAEVLNRVALVLAAAGGGSVGAMVGQIFGG